jgi:hypothetical protein
MSKWKQVGANLFGFEGIARMLMGSVQGALVGMKMSGKLDWSWWLVLSPVWIPLVVWVLCWLIAIGAWLTEGAKDMKRRKW